MKAFIKRFIQRQRQWSIGIYVGSSPFDWSTPTTMTNPVLQAADVTDVPAAFVADPFMVREGDRWYLFFEVFQARDRRGEIGLATSSDGWHWQYQQIVLREPFHLSYPYVFQWQGTYYMIPESCARQAVRLYRATHFPTQWEFVQNLLEGDFVDSSIFYFNQRWWLFTTSQQSDSLRLYFADRLCGTWTEHLCSPVIQHDLSIARPGGRVIVAGETVIRYTQDVGTVYGKQVRAFIITTLTTTDYREQAVAQNPVLQPSQRGWNATGMHTIDPHQLDDGRWIACVDGYRFAIALNRVKRAANPSSHRPRKFSSLKLPEFIKPNSRR